MPTEIPLAMGVHADSGERLAGIDEEALESFSGQSAEMQVSDEVDAKSKSHLGTDDDVEDHTKLDQTGWAIIFGASIGDDVKKQLEPLIEHRRRQVYPRRQVGNDRLFQIFSGADSYQVGEGAEPGEPVVWENEVKHWLAKNGKNIAMNEVDPKKGVPYYVMIVASPDEIPFEFQYWLDLYWAVGRLWFPAADEYGIYARSVVDYETASSVATSRQMAIFAPRNGEDHAMGLFTDNMARPMMAPTETKPPFGSVQNFRLRPFLGDPATTETLEDIWRGKVKDGPPAVVFTGSHGMVFFAGDERQAAQQGAIVCNEWRGKDPPKRSHYYAAEDLPSDARVHGMIPFVFNCFGAGWPRNDTFGRTSKRPAKLAEGPMLARLPQALLSHKGGGALAVLGHVDRAWSYSYRSSKLGPQIEGFRTLMNRLMAGECIGHATDKLNQRWSVLSAGIAEDLQRKDNGLPVDLDALKSKWVARDDARNYIVFGDPAVRLRVADMPVLSE